MSTFTITIPAEPASVLSLLRAAGYTGPDAVVYTKIEAERPFQLATPPCEFVPGVFVLFAGSDYAEPCDSVPETRLKALTPTQAIVVIKETP